MRAAESFHPNFILAEDGSGKTVILHGDHLAQHTTYGEEVDPALVESVFRPESERAKRRFVQLFSHVPDDALELAHALRDWTEREQGVHLCQSALIAFCEELDRALQGQPPPRDTYPDDLDQLYPQEAAAAQWALTQVGFPRKLSLDPQAATAITWAMVGEQLELAQDQPKLEAVTTLMREAVGLIESTLQRTLAPNGPDTRRFLLHLRYFVRRVLNDHPNRHEVDQDWYLSFTQLYPQAHQCTLNVAQWVERQYHHTVGLDERMYLLIHLAQMLRTQDTSLLPQD